MDISEETKPRKPWLAALLSLLIPGLGQLYNGRWAKAVLFLIINLLGQSALLLVFTYIHPAPLNVIVTAFLIISLRLYFAIDAFQEAQIIGPAYRLRPFNKWYVYLLAVSCLEMVVLPYAHHQPFAQSYRLPGGAMQNTLLIGDCLVVRKIAYGLPMFGRKRFIADVRHGDIIAFEVPQAGMSTEEKAKGSKKDFVKRVIGLPGDEITIKNKRLYINGQPNTEPYAIFLDSMIIPDTREKGDPMEYQKSWEQGDLAQFSYVRDNFGPIKVPPGSFFVMGDNRDGSFDGRFWGPLPGTLIKGKAYKVLWSQDHKTHGIRWARMGKAIN